MKARLLS